LFSVDLDFDFSSWLSAKLVKSPTKSVPNFDSQTFNTPSTLKASTIATILSTLGDKCANTKLIVIFNKKNTDVPTYANSSIIKYNIF